jgi:hypothetical protein
MRYDDFAQQVEAVGLTPRRCTSDHWQLRGGLLVNVWPHGRRGFRLQIDREKSRLGTLAEAIHAAGPPPKPAEPKPERPPWEAEQGRVGLIRAIGRFLWRWLW